MKKETLNRLFELREQRNKAQREILAILKPIARRVLEPGRGIPWAPNQTNGDVAKLLREYHPELIAILGGRSTDKKWMEIFWLLMNAADPVDASRRKRWEKGFLNYH